MFLHVVLSRKPVNEPSKTDSFQLPLTFIFYILDFMSDFHPFFHEHEHDDDLVVLNAQPKLKKPSLYRVILLNDDFTPMDFVIEILVNFFGMSEEQATAVMLQVHTRGVGICGTYSKDVAETKVYIVNSYAFENNHPLKCEMEEI